MKYNEKGSVTMIVAVTILFIVILLSSFLVYTSARRRAQIEETALISNAYDGDMDTIYNQKIASEDTVTMVEDVPIPKGFYYVGGTKEGGVVISDNQSDENKYQGQVNVGTDDVQGNQFVWVPVNYEDYIADSNSGYSDEYDEASTQVSSDIKESIQKYGGFYIGRYETGIENNNTVIKKGVTPYTNVNFETAVNVSDGLYDENSNEYGATSTLITGKQWDSFLNNVKDKVDINNSSNWGNYSTNNGVGRDKQDNNITVDLQDGMEIMIPYYETTIKLNAAWVDKIGMNSDYYARILSSLYYTDENGYKLNFQQLLEKCSMVPENEDDYIYDDKSSTTERKFFVHKSPIDADTPTSSNLILNITSNPYKEALRLVYEREDNFLQKNNVVDVIKDAIKEVWGIDVTIDENANITSIVTNNRNAWIKEPTINVLSSMNKRFTINKMYFANWETNSINILQEANTMENTGYSDAWSVNNVYDLAGNVEEWVRESNGSDTNAVRGGKYYVDEQEYYANSRRDAAKSEQSTDLGFRVALYIK